MSDESNQVGEREERAIQSLRSIMFIIGDDHPRTVYTGEGYEVWLRAAAREILRQAGDPPAVVERAQDLLDAVGDEMPWCGESMPEVGEAWEKLRELADDHGLLPGIEAISG